MAVSIEHHGNIAVVSVDNPPVNALSQRVRQGLLDAVAAVDADDALTAAVLQCAGRTFIAGADLDEFGKPPRPPHLPDVVAAIERAVKPWTAAIHGSALGGGLEVALGCRFRVAAASARLGLPEVTLGIVPGAGGTVRLPRLVPLDAAIEMVTGGRPVSAHQAAEAGLLDAVIDGDLLSGAIAFVREALTRPLPPAAADREPPRADEALWTDQQVALRKRGRGQFSPLAALACLRTACDADLDTALRFERETFLRLRGSDEARALRHVFFAERAAPKPAEIKDIAPRRVERAGVVGGGTMGAGIAAALRDAGLPVTLLERSADAAERGRETLIRIYDASVKRGRLSDQERDERLAGVNWTTDTADLADADLVIEAVFEDLAVKREVFARLSASCRPDAILATNTSYLDPRAIAEAAMRPDRFLGLHFFSPAHVMKLVEIIPIAETAPDVLAAGFALARRLRKIPVRAGICEGFIGNRILKRYRAAAEALLRKGMAITDVDAAMRDFGYGMGPFEAQDLGGLEIAAFQRAAARAGGRDVPEALADILVAAGRKGQKTGGGWYDYRPGDRRGHPSPEVARLLSDRLAATQALPGKAIAARLVAEMADEGAALLAEGIATGPASIDLVTIHGYGFPRWRGGLMHYVAAQADHLRTASSRPFGPFLARFLRGAGV